MSVVCAEAAAVSFVTGDVVAKEQLHGVVGAPVTAPPAAPSPSRRVGGTGVRRRHTPLMLTLTAHGDVLINIPLTPEPPKS